MEWHMFCVAQTNSRKLPQNIPEPVVTARPLVTEQFVGHFFTLTSQQCASHTMYAASVNPILCFYSARLSRLHRHSRHHGLQCLRVSYLCKTESKPCFFRSLEWQRPTFVYTKCKSRTMDAEWRSYVSMRSASAHMPMTQTGDFPFPKIRYIYAPD